MTLEKRRRGREMFASFQPILGTASRAVAHAPASLRRALLSSVRNVGGYHGLAIRYVLVRSLAQSCGRNVAIYQGVHLHNLDRISFGSNIKVGEMSFIGGAGRIMIEDDVSIAHGSSILTEEHDLAPGVAVRDSPLVLRPVRLEQGSLIGAGCRVLAGVTVGSNAMVGAGSVVTRDVPKDIVAAGVPARPLTTPRPGVGAHRVV